MGSTKRVLSGSVAISLPGSEAGRPGGAGYRTGIIAVAGTPGAVRKQG